ncbi:MAG: hypothetical protein U0640_10665 [Phycisphaerales bacterium]
MDMLFGGGAAWFTVPALLGTGVFLIRLIMMLAGAGHDSDLGGHAGDVHAGDGHHGEDHGQHGIMAVVSVQGLAAFAMGFGWAGLGAYQGLKWGMVPSMALGVGGGVAMALLFLGLMTTTRKLNTSGNIDFSKTVGTEAEVYATIPAKGGGRGQVRIVVSGRQRILQATSNDSEYSTGTRVRVLEAKADNSVVVGPT